MSIDGTRVAVIGGGLAGLACAGALREAGFRVTVFDKGRAVGGRTSTRREGGWRFDHGAPRLELGAPELDEARAAWQAAGVIVPWCPRVAGAARDRPTWIGVPGSNALAIHLATGLDVEPNARVVSIARRGGWWLEVEHAGRRASRGPFELVVITAPTPQAIALLATTAADDLRATLSTATFVPCVVAMLALEASSLIDELHSTTEPFASAHRIDRRPGRLSSPGVELWVAHGSEAWSTARLEEDEQDAARELAAAMARHVAGRVIQLRGHRWRYARAATRIAGPYAYDDAHQLGIAGDSFSAGTSAPAASRALISGIALARRIITANHRG
ncbi:MAG: FAD-dependent oxidoreductase [Proteobacteria bacterium]|nr:FAD-dependent oxidoreductase [Pseudomonadota bacterium]